MARTSAAPGSGAETGSVRATAALDATAEPAPEDREGSGFPSTSPPCDASIAVAVDASMPVPRRPPAAPPRTASAAEA